MGAPGEQSPGATRPLSAIISAAQSRRRGIEALASNESEQWSVASAQWMEAGRVTGTRQVAGETRFPGALSASISEQ